MFTKTLFGRQNNAMTRIQLLSYSYRNLMTFITLSKLSRPQLHAKLRACYRYISSVLGSGLSPETMSTWRDRTPQRSRNSSRQASTSREKKSRSTLGPRDTGASVTRGTRYRIRMFLVLIIPTEASVESYRSPVSIRFLSKISSYAR